MSRNGSTTKIPTVSSLTDELNAALALLDQQTADEIIGEEPEEHKLLIRGANAALGLQWQALKSLGMKETPQMLKSGGQVLLMVVSLVHYAYALGIRRGREEPGG